MDVVFHCATAAPTASNAHNKALMTAVNVQVWAEGGAAARVGWGGSRARVGGGKGINWKAHRKPSGGAGGINSLAVVDVPSGQPLHLRAAQRASPLAHGPGNFPAALPLLLCASSPTMPGHAQRGGGLHPRPGAQAGLHQLRLGGVRGAGPAGGGRGHALRQEAARLLHPHQDRGWVGRRGWGCRAGARAWRWVLRCPPRTLPKTRPPASARAAGERIVRAANGCGGLATVSLRPSGIFGEHDTLLVPTTVEKAKQVGSRRLFLPTGFLCVEFCVHHCGSGPAGGQRQVFLPTVFGGFSFWCTSVKKAQQVGSGRFFSHWFLGAQFLVHQCGESPAGGQRQVPSHWPLVTIMVYIFCYSVV